MTIDIDKLMSFDIPTARQTVSARDIALYSLSVGMGQNPVDPRELAFTDPLRGPRVMPSMVLVMAHPGFYLGDPESGVDPTAVLHAEQSFEIHREIPSGGEISSSTRITDVVDKGAGKAALIYAETSLANSEGRKFATLSRIIFVREGGGFGGQKEPCEPRSPTSRPDGSPDQIIRLETRPEQALLYRLNGDLNPLHSDPNLASALGFERPILHGLCTMGVICHAVLRGLGNYRDGALCGASLRFSGPVYPGDTLQTEIWDDGHFRATVPARDVVVVDCGRATITPQ